MPHEHHAPADSSERRAGRGGRRGAGRGVDPGAPEPHEDVGGARHAGGCARGRGGRASAPPRRLCAGDQRAVRHHPRRAAGDRAQGRDRGREEAAMTLWWIGSILLLVVVLPVVIYLLHGVLSAAKSIVPSIDRIAAAAAAGSKDLDAVPLLLTTQQ